MTLLPCRLLLCAALLFAHSSAVAQVVINEIVPANDTGLRDENGGFSDWLELYNASDEPVDLEGWGLTDSPRRPFEWVLRNAILPARGFLTIFASGKDRQPAAVEPLAPHQIPGLQLWLSADAIDVSNSTEVRSGGTSKFVRRWSDQSGLNNHATQAADANQPTLITNAINGKPALRFDGANDVVTLARPLATNDFTILAVFRTTLNHEIDPESPTGVGGVSGQRWLFGCGHGGDFNGGSGVSVGANGISAYEHGSSYMPALAVYAAPVAPTFNVLALTYAAKRPSLSLQGFTVRDGLTSLRAQVTSTVQIGAGDYGAFNGDLAEVLLFNRTLTESERLGAERYLAAKYAIALPLPRHTNFRLSASGETVVLTKPDGAEADRIGFGEMAGDVSFGRQPDGTAGLLYFPQPTPGASNLTAGAEELLPGVGFSIPAGFYTTSFNLELSTAAGAAIRYTTDGSDPTESSLLYAAPIQIRSRAGAANGISTIPTVPGGQPPVSEVFKGTVIRARAFKTNALSAPPVTRSYFVDARGRARYTLPVVSITTEPKNFFDPAIGIYVPGNAPNGNYSQRGAAWERPAHVEIFETNNVRVLASESGVTIHGNTSQNFAIKALDFNANGGRGRGRFEYQIFPDRNRFSFDHFLLRPSGHDQMYTFMRDEMMQSLMHDNGMEAQAARACVTFVNGEYWGLSYLKEKEDDDFVADNGNVPIDQLDYLEGYAAAKAGDTAHYNAMINFIGTHDLRVTENYEQVKGMMEVANYIDYKAAEIYYYRWDIGNHRFWRPRTPEGRWRWLQFDNDVGWGGFWAIQPAWDFNMLAADFATDGSLNGHNTETTTFLLRKLAANEEFKIDFINRFADLLNSTFLPTNTIARINAHAAILEPEMTEHTRRWRAPASLSEWRNNVQYLRTFGSNRPAAMRRHLTEKFGLSPTAQVRLAVSKPAGGTLQVNTLETAATTNAPWTGIYFKDLPLKFTAKPSPGYKFSGWEGLLGVPTNSVTLQLRGDLTLTAHFAPERILLEARFIDDKLEIISRGPARLTCDLVISPDLETWESIGTLTFDNTGAGAATIETTFPSGYLQLRVP